MVLQSTDAIETEYKTRMETRLNKYKVCLDMAHMLTVYTRLKQKKRTCGEKTSSVNVLFIYTLVCA